MGSFYRHSMMIIQGFFYIFPLKKLKCPVLFELDRNTWYHICVETNNYYYSLRDFHNSISWNLRDRKILQVSETLLNILANLNIAVVWMVFILPLILEISWLEQWNTLTASLQRDKTSPPMSVLDMTLSNLMVRLQRGKFEECGIPLHGHCSQVHSGPEWEHLIGSYIRVK